jgi:hypothetical protein
MGALAIVLIVVGGVVLALLVGGYIVVRTRRQSEDSERRILEADRALERARAADKGWDRAILERVAGEALRAQRPDLGYDAIELVLVDDRPGVVNDCAHLVARGPEGHARMVLIRNEGGDWAVERID